MVRVSVRVTVGVAILGVAVVLAVGVAVGTAVTLACVPVGWASGREVEWIGWRGCWEWAFGMASVTAREPTTRRERPRLGLSTSCQPIRRAKRGVAHEE